MWGERPNTAFPPTEGSDMTPEEAIKYAGERGRIFSVDFRKRETEAERHMVCRLGVKRGVVGVGMAYNPKDRRLVVVWDMQRWAYRMVNLDTVWRVRGRGKEWCW